MISSPRYEQFIKAESEINALKKKVSELEKKAKEKSTATKPSNEKVSEDVSGGDQMKGEGGDPTQDAVQISKQYQEEKDLPGHPILGEQAKSKTEEASQECGGNLQGKGSNTALEKEILGKVWTKNHGKVKRLLSSLKKKKVTWNEKGEFQNAQLRGLMLQNVIPVTVQSSNQTVPENIKKWCNFLRDNDMDLFISNSTLLPLYAWYYIGDT